VQGWIQEFIRVKINFKFFSCSPLTISGVSGRSMAYAPTLYPPLSMYCKYCILLVKTETYDIIACLGLGRINLYIRLGFKEVK